MNIGQRLRSLRKSKGLSLGDVQERTGMHGSHLSRVETGRIVPSLETLQRWAWALDAELYQFFLEDGQSLPPGATNRGAMRSLDSREERLVDLFGRMDVRNQDLILSLAESVDRHLPKAVGNPARKPGPRPGAFSSGGRTFAKLTARETSDVDVELVAGESR
ncbi:MAG TPA: helix-turn-helix transcriptional regulator [Terriglobia bacterium]|nr:helix-turn-helix transcriptional regulator [Terriglobia bacterium]